MKRSVDLPLTIRPVVGMRDEYPAGFVDLSHSHERLQLAFAPEGTMTVKTDHSAFVLPVRRAICIRPVSFMKSSRTGSFAQPR